MSQELITQNQAELTKEQVELIKTTVAKGATDNELKLFLTIAKKTQLDPFTRQIHFVKRKTWNRERRQYEDVGTIQTGIDGYRAIAERTGTLAGIDDAVYEEGTKYPKKASVTVYRIVQAQRVGFTASARWSEYAPTNDKGELINPMWRKMPFLMLGKCAEALALRKAFPHDLSGLYTKEEMEQADGGAPDTGAEQDTETTPDTPFLAAQKLVAGSNRSENLIVLDEKFQKSNKLTKEEKEQLHSIISAKVDRFSHAA